MQNAQIQDLINKLKSGTKTNPEVTLNLSSNGIDHSNDKTNFLHILWLTNTYVSRIRKAFANGSSLDIKLLKT